MLRYFLLVPAVCGVHVDDLKNAKSRFDSVLSHMVSSGMSGGGGGSHACPEKDKTVLNAKVHSTYCDATHATAVENLYFEPGPAQGSWAKAKADQAIYDVSGAGGTVPVSGAYWDDPAQFWTLSTPAGNDGAAYGFATAHTPTGGTARGLLLVEQMFGELCEPCFHGDDATRNATAKANMIGSCIDKMSEDDTPVLEGMGCKICSASDDDLCRTKTVDWREGSAPTHEIDCWSFNGAAAFNFAHHANASALAAGIDQADVDKFLAHLNDVYKPLADAAWDLRKTGVTAAQTRVGCYHGYTETTT